MVTARRTLAEAPVASLKIASFLGGKTGIRQFTMCDNDDEHPDPAAEAPVIVPDADEVNFTEPESGTAPSDPSFRALMTISLSGEM